MKPFIVIADGFDENLFKQLRSIEQFDVHSNAKPSPQELISLLPKLNALVIRSRSKITSDLLNKANNLQLIIRAGEGTDNIDKEACKKKGVKVANTPGANHNSAAEHAIALMMSCLRKVPQASSHLQQGGWDKEKFKGMEISGKTIGIVGFGRIGRMVAEKLSGFSPRIIYYDPLVEKPPSLEVERIKSIEDIFRTSDIVTIHVPLLAQTKNLIDGKLIGMMKKTAILINAARGEILEESALVSALDNNSIFAAGLDVFKKEPLDSQSPLRNFSNV
ncbi:MAG: hydroxyacid dehydrogenase, partial [Halobacteriovoraceae bacterium]|nr:hydroxyacid dehydrogenase [Halobacteriovoraceae bacterium]